jgi:hypothetical protein
MSSFSIPRGTVPYRSKLGWLPLSVALNLVLIGLVVGWELNLPPPPRQPLLTWQRELIPALSPADAMIVRVAAGQVADAQAAGDLAIHLQFDKVRAILAAEPVDHAALVAAFNEMANIRERQQMLVGKAFTDELYKISAEGRQKIRAALIVQGERWRPTPGR